MMKKTHIIGGGTLSYVDPHLALCSPAYGTVAKRLHELCLPRKLETHLHLTRMAGGEKSLDTVGDVAKLVAGIVDDYDAKILFMPVAMCDFMAKVDYGDGVNCIQGGKDNPRISSHLEVFVNQRPILRLFPYEKVIATVRSKRKDIFLVGFKQTTGLSDGDQYVAGLNLLKGASCNLVLANDTKTRLNMVITPEEARYHVTKDRDEALSGLVEMAYLRSHLTFTRSTVVSGDSIPWNSCLVPHALRTVVNYCVGKGAYKEFRGATVGHFACKINDTTFLTSKRKTNFNDMDEHGLVMIKTDGPDSVIAYGSKPSVGGQSQRIVFHDHQEYDCIVHFHTEIRPESQVPRISQREIECGSHQCGKNTSDGLKRFGNLSAVYLQEHGPNIVFHRSVNPQEVIDFIESNFDLSKKTGGEVN